MKTIDLSRGKRNRMDSDGTLWTHIPCPYCEKRGHGPDPSTHMGVGIAPSGTVASKCLRCGASLPRFATFTLGGRTFQAAKKSGRYRMRQAKKLDTDPSALSADRIPGIPVEAIGEGTKYRQHIERVCKERWPSLDFDQLLAAGLRVVEGGWNTYYCPVWTTAGWGWVERRIDREPKALNHGPKGVGFMRPIDPGEEKDWVWVEGWFDAIAVPPPYEPVILRGVTHWPDRMKGRVYLALDPDEAGRSAIRKMIPRLWSSGMDVHLVTLPDGDPADCGTEGMVEALRGAVKIETVKEFVEWLSRKSS